MPRPTQKPSSRPRINMEKTQLTRKQAEQQDRILETTHRLNEKAKEHKRKGK